MVIRFLAAALLLTAAAPSPSTAGRCANREPPHAQQEGNFTVRHDGSLDRAALRHLVERAQRAWSFDVTEYGWSDDGGLRDPVEIWLLPDCAFVSPGGRVGARTVGRSRVELPLSALLQSNLDGVLAHELSHVQFNRVAEPRCWPRYLHEGQAFSLGKRYRTVTGGGTSAGDAVRAAQAEHLSRQKARFVIEESRRWMEASPSWQDARADGARNVTGMLFVAFLERRYSDVFVRLARAGLATRAASTADDAFRQAFGRTLAELETDFLDSLAR